MLPYQLTDRARRDIVAGRSWYDQHSTDLGNRFLDAVLTAIRSACELPHACSEKHRGIRVVRCRRFPYRVYFHANEIQIVVLAVYHTARDPGGWDDLGRV